MDDSTPSEAPKAGTASGPKQRRKRLLIALGAIGIAIVMIVAAVILVTRDDIKDSDDDGVTDAFDNFPDGNGKLIFAVDHIELEERSDIIFRLSVETTGDNTYDKIFESSEFSYIKERDHIWGITIDVPDDLNYITIQLAVIDVSLGYERYIGFGNTVYGTTMSFTLMQNSFYYEMPIYCAFSNEDYYPELTECAITFSFHDAT